MKELIVSGNTHQVQKDDFSESKVFVDGKAYNAMFIPLPDGRKLCLIDGKVVEWSNAQEKHHKFVFFDGKIRNLAVVDPRRLRTSGADQSSAGIAEIVAPMPGRVISVKVEEGQAVEKNQGLVVLEAMKMENELRAPFPGIVNRLDVTPGSTVEQGHIIAIIEPPE